MAVVELFGVNDITLATSGLILALGSYLVSILYTISSKMDSSFNSITRLLMNLIRSAFCC